jgi:hypothetical protein
LHPNFLFSSSAHPYQLCATPPPWWIFEQAISSACCLHARQEINGVCHNAFGFTWYFFLILETKMLATEEFFMIMSTSMRFNFCWCPMVILMSTLHTMMLLCREFWLGVDHSKALVAAHQIANNYTRDVYHTDHNFLVLHFVLNENIILNSIPFDHFNDHGREALNAGSICQAVAPTLWTHLQDLESCLHP